ncbi:MAG: hypothetical protein M1819_004031 [Sarea resinae]|nr:MAG: hypothetical protein M1819_004031 [Sarea resinae]
MAQGPSSAKKPQKAVNHARNASSKSKVSKGARMIAPKNQRLIRQKNITKKLTSGLTARTERSLAEKAGHLEILGGGKKDKKDAKKAANGGKGGHQGKGGK